MSEKLRAARRLYWSSMPPEQRTERMRSIAKARQKRLTTAQKRAHALMMVEAKKNKRKGVQHQGATGNPDHPWRKDFHL